MPISTAARVALPVLLALSTPVALLYGCGGSTAHDSSPSPDAAAEGSIAPHPDGGAHEGAADAASDAPAESGYKNQAPHCVRTDAGVADPFDAGGVPDVASLAQVENYGGQPLHRPTFVSVTFAGDQSADELADYVASVGCTDYWHAIAGDYGVGDGVAGPAVALTEAAPASIDDPGIRTWLRQKIESKDPQFPKPTGDIVYVLWYPETTTITLQGVTSCQGFGGYHEGGQLSDGTPFSYAVLPRCPVQGGTIMDGLTLSASHELIEACTDPQPDTAPAYAAPDSNHLAWLLAEASEVGDLCEFDPSAAYLPAGFPWYVQRIYSNRAAAAGNNPCVPAATPTYFYGAPLVPDLVPLDLLGTGTPTPSAAVKIAVGASATVPVQLIGPASITSMQVQAYDIAQFTGQQTTLGLALSAASGAPGTTLQLTITKQSASPPPGVTAFVIVTSSGQQQTFQIALTAD